MYYLYTIATRFRPTADTGYLTYARTGCTTAILPARSSVSADDPWRSTVGSGWCRALLIGRQCETSGRGQSSCRVTDDQGRRVATRRRPSRLGRKLVYEVPACVANERVRAPRNEWRWSPPCTGARTPHSRQRSSYTVGSVFGRQAATRLFDRLSSLCLPVPSMVVFRTRKNSAILSTWRRTDRGLTRQRRGYPRPI